MNKKPAKVNETTAIEPNITILNKCMSCFMIAAITTPPSISFETSKQYFPISSLINANIFQY